MQVSVLSLFLCVCICGFLVYLSGFFSLFLCFNQVISCAFHLFYSLFCFFSWLRSWCIFFSFSIFICKCEIVFSNLQMLLLTFHSLFSFLFTFSLHFFLVFILFFLSFFLFLHVFDCDMDVSFAFSLVYHNISCFVVLKTRNRRHLLSEIVVFIPAREIINELHCLDIKKRK